MPPVPFSSYGAKVRLAHHLAGLLPPHRVYVEAFAGSAALPFAKQPSAVEVVNDVHGDIANFFTVLRDQPDRLQRAVQLTPYARAEYDSARQLDEQDDLDPLERAPPLVAALLPVLQGPRALYPFRRGCNSLARLPTDAQ